MAEVLSEVEALRVLGGELGDCCPMCRGSLADVSDPSCPHCGAALTIRVNLDDPRMTAWVVGLIGLCAGAGFCGIVVASIAAAGQVDRLVALGFWTQIVGVVVLGGGAVGWVRYRRAIRLMPAERRAWLACGCWGASALFTAVLAVLVAIR